MKPRFLPLVVLLKITSCTMLGRNPYKNATCDSVESIFESEYIPSFENGYRFVRHDGKNREELILTESNKRYKCFFTRNDNLREFEIVDPEHITLFTKDMDKLKEGNFIQTCPETHYHHPVDSFFYVRSGNIHFQYVSFSNTPLSLNENAVRKVGDENFRKIQVIYSIYYRNK